MENNQNNQQIRTSRVILEGKENGWDKVNSASSTFANVCTGVAMLTLGYASYKTCDHFFGEKKKKKNKKSKKDFDDVD